MGGEEGLTYVKAENGVVEGNVKFSDIWQRSLMK